jgi:hypothetical protein
MLRCHGTFLRSGSYPEITVVNGKEEGKCFARSVEKNIPNE